MIVNFSPMRFEAPITLARQGDLLMIDGDEIDLATYLDGDSVWILGQPQQVGGVWHVAILLPHGPDAPDATLYPQPLEVTADGPIDLPPYGAAP